MKNIKKLFLSALLLCFGILLFKGEVQAQNLDEIRDYQIAVENKEDGSLMITYHLEWEVLDSDSDGPLTWIKVGIPNEWVEEMWALSDNIEDISYYGKGGDYVRIDLDREYEAGEILNIDFAIHQHQMYETAKNSYQYHFTPGWFEDICIDHMEIFWTARDGMSSSMELTGAYYTAEKYDLREGEKLTVKMEYDKVAYSFQDYYREQEIKERRKESGQVYMVLFLIVPTLCISWLLLFRRKKEQKDYYTVHSGMGKHYYHNHIVPHSTGRSSGGGCACACACAGGGRAGCSVKAFIRLPRIRPIKEK